MNFLSFVVIGALILGVVAVVTAILRRAQRKHAQQAAWAVTAERTRIARDMHDSVAHSLAAIVTLADGAAVTVARDPQLATTAMHRAAETGRLALAEMRRVIGPAQEPPEPSRARVDNLLNDIAR